MMIDIYMIKCRCDGRRMYIYIYIYVNIFLNEMIEMCALLCCFEEREGGYVF